MRHPTRWPWLLGSLVATCALVAGCSGGDAKNSSQQAVGAAQRLARAKTTLDAAPSVHFAITSSGVPAGGTSLVGGEGSAARPGKFMGTLKVSFAGSPATVEVISVDGLVYAKLPFAAQYAITDPAQFGFADPGRFMDPTAGITSLLVKATDSTVTEKSRIGGELVQQVKASIPGDVVEDLLVSADPSKPVAATFSIAEQSGQLRRAVVTGPFFAKGVASTFTIVLDRYGEKVDVRAPSTG